MLRATEMAHLLLRQSLKPGDWVVDATVGNGHDTLWLAQIVGPTGRVLGFDAQAAALAAAAQRLQGLPQVTLFHAGHERLAEHLPADAKAKLAAVMFNLGFLPGADKSVITTAETTLAALDQALGNLALRGQITVVLYPGHPGGAGEAEEVLSWAHSLPAAFPAARYSRLNTVHPAPELLAIERVA
jgi:SAM-dependent methyltransferase